MTARYRDRKKEKLKVWLTSLIFLLAKLWQTKRAADIGVWNRINEESR
jgi:hypothetical protein